MAVSGENKLYVLNSKYLSKEYVESTLDKYIKKLESNWSSKIHEINDENEKKEKAKLWLDEYCVNVICIQYMNENIEEIFKKQNEKQVTNFLKKYIEFDEVYGKVRIRTIVKEDEIEEFLNYAKDSHLKKINKPLNGKNFLKMCRVCFDAAPYKMFPDFISDYFIYRYERGSSFENDHAMIDPKCYESEKEFLKKYPLYGYHLEEIRFGGPCVHINRISKWVGSFSARTSSPEVNGRVIKMYNALRKNGYPLTIDEPYKVLNSYLGWINDNEISGVYEWFNSIEEAISSKEGKK